MIFSKVAGLVAAFAAIGAAAAVCMVAISFAIYAGLRDVIGPAWAAAAVAGIVALLALIIAILATRKAKPSTPVQDAAPSPLVRAMQLAQDRPVLAAGAATVAAAAVAVIAIKNPRILTAIIAGLVGRLAPPPRR